MTDNLSAADFLKRAEELMRSRGATYDAKDRQERSMGRIVSTFNVLTGRGRDALTEEDGWLFMVILKLVRLRSAPTYHHDSNEDFVAYASLMAEAAMYSRRESDLRNAEVSEFLWEERLWVHPQPESATKKPDLSNLAEIAARLDLTVDELLSEWPEAAFSAAKEAKKKAQEAAWAYRVNEIVDIQPEIDAIEAEWPEAAFSAAKEARKERSEPIQAKFGLDIAESGEVRGCRPLEPGAFHWKPHYPPESAMAKTTTAASGIKICPSTGLVHADDDLWKM